MTGYPPPSPETRKVMAAAGIIFRDCPVCGFPFVGGKGGQAPYMQYCSNACRQKAYRLRHGQRYPRPGRPAKTLTFSRVAVTHSDGEKGIS